MTVAERRAFVDVRDLLAEYDRLLLDARRELATYRGISHAALAMLSDYERQNVALRQRLQGLTDGWACPRCNGVPRRKAGV